MKIKLKNNKLGITNLIVPIDGMISINPEGVAEVSEQCGEILLGQIDNWEKVVKKTAAETTTPAADEKTEETKKDSKEEDSKEENEELTDEQIIEGIKSLSLEEAINLAKESGYPEKEWKKMSAKANLMSAYLIKKFKQSKK